MAPITDASQSKGLWGSKYAPEPTAASNIVKPAENLALNGMRHPSQQLEPFFCAICGKDYTNNRSEFFQAHLMLCKLSISMNQHFKGKYDKETGQLEDAPTEVDAKKSSIGNVTTPATSSALPANSQDVSAKDITQKWAGARTITSLTAPKPTGWVGSRIAQPIMVAASSTPVLERYRASNMPAGEDEAVVELRKDHEILESTYTDIVEGVQPTGIKEAENGCKSAVEEKKKEIEDISQKAFDNAVSNDMTSTTSSSLAATTSPTESYDSSRDTSIPFPNDNCGTLNEISEASINELTSSRLGNIFVAPTSTTVSENHSNNGSTSPGTGVISKPLMPSESAAATKEDSTKQFDVSSRGKKLLDNEEYTVPSSNSEGSEDKSKLVPVLLKDLSRTPAPAKVEEEFAQGIAAYLKSKGNTAAASSSTTGSKLSSSKTLVPSHIDVTEESLESDRPLPASSILHEIDPSKATTTSIAKPNRSPVMSDNPFAWADSTTWRNLATASPAYFDSNRPKTKASNRQMEIEEFSVVSDIKSKVPIAAQVARGALGVSSTTGTARLGISQWAPDHLKVQKPDKTAKGEGINKEM